MAKGETQNKEKNFISAVVYMRNCRDGAAAFISELDNILYEHFLKYEIVVVNDGSNDGTGHAVREAGRNARGVVTLLNMSYPQGTEQCMNAGIDLAIGDYVIEFDSINCDFDWDTVIKAYHKVLEGNDIVYAINERKERRPDLFYRLFNRYSQIPHKINEHTFCVITRRGINRVRSLTKTVPYRKALYANCGISQTNVPYTPTAGAVGRRVKEDKPYSSLILFTDMAYRFAIGMVVCMSLVTLGALIYTVVQFCLGSPVAGWTTTMLLVGASFLGVFIILGVIMKYLSLIVSLVFRKQNYVFESIEKLN